MAKSLSAPEVSASATPLDELESSLSRKFRVTRYGRGFEVASSDIYSCIEFMKNGLGYDYLRDITATDWLYRDPSADRFEVIYQMTNMAKKDLVAIKTRVKDGEKLQSVVGLYPAANYLEREIYDLMGIVFEDHPDLRRLLLSDDWEGHPLRKDYPVSGYEMWNWEAHR